MLWWISVCIVIYVEYVNKSTIWFFDKNKYSMHAWVHISIWSTFNILKVFRVFKITECLCKITHIVKWTYCLDLFFRYVMEILRHFIRFPYAIKPPSTLQQSPFTPLTFEVRHNHWPNPLPTYVGDLATVFQVDWKKKSRFFGSPLSSFI